MSNVTRKSKTVSWKYYFGSISTFWYKSTLLLWLFIVFFNVFYMLLGQFWNIFGIFRVTLVWLYKMIEHNIQLRIHYKNKSGLSWRLEEYTAFCISVLPKLEIPNIHSHFVYSEKTLCSLLFHVMKVYAKKVEYIQMAPSGLVNVSTYCAETNLVFVYCL